MDKDLFYKFIMSTTISIRKNKKVFFWLPFDKTLQIKANMWTDLITKASIITKKTITTMYYIKSTKIIEKKNRLKNIVNSSIPTFFDVIPALQCTNKLFEETHSYRLAFKFKHQVWNKPITQIKEICSFKILYDGLLLAIK